MLVGVKSIKLQASKMYGEKDLELQLDFFLFFKIYLADGLGIGIV